MTSGAICQALGIGKLAMWGISGGGPHVLACAALAPDLVSAAASLASPAPYGADGLDWFAGMGQHNADDFRLLLADKDTARAKLENDRQEFLAASPGGGSGHARPVVRWPAAPRLVFLAGVLRRLSRT